MWIFAKMGARFGERAFRDDFFLRDLLATLSNHVIFSYFFNKHVSHFVLNFFHLYDACIIYCICIHVYVFPCGMVFTIFQPFFHPSSN